MTVEQLTRPDGPAFPPPVGIAVPSPRLTFAPPPPPVPPALTFPPPPPPLPPAPALTFAPPAPPALTLAPAAPAAGPALTGPRIAAPTIPPPTQLPTPKPTGGTRPVTAFSFPFELDPSAAAPKKRKKRSPMRMFMALIVLAALVAGGMFAWRKYDGFGLFDPTRPDAWDPQVLDAVNFVETERGLAFQHPVWVKFMTDQEFQAQFAPEPGAEPTAADVEQAGGYFDALALAESGYNPYAGQREVYETASLGFYDPETETVFMRGTVLTPAVRAVLVHELTHALQDQHFDMQLGGPTDLEVRSVIEADALRVENAFVDTLSEADRLAVQHDTGGSSGDELADIPQAVLDQTYAPYILGPAFVEARLTAGGNAAVDASLTRAPTQEELLAPELFGTGTGDISIAAQVPTGVTVLQPPTPLPLFSALQMLDAWLPWSMSRDALNGWAGGSSATYLDGSGSVCVSMAIANDTVAHATTLHNALVWWAGAAGSNAIPTLMDSTVSMVTCERTGTSVAPPEDRFTTSVSARLETMAYQWVAAQTGDPSPLSRCVARQIVSDPALAELVPLAGTPEHDPRLTDAAAFARAACGA